jgi:hypothetical protein
LKRRSPSPRLGKATRMSPCPCGLFSQRCRCVSVFLKPHGFGWLFVDLAAVVGDPALRMQRVIQFERSLSSNST